MHAVRQDDRRDRGSLRHRRAHRRTRRRTWAPTSSASTSTTPARPLDAFIKADLGSAAGRRRDRARAAAAHRRLLQRRRRVGHDRRGEDAGDQFLRPARADRSGGAASARGRRGRQCRLHRRLRLARQSRAREGASSARQGFPISRRCSRSTASPTARAIRCRRSCCCCGPCGRRISRCSRTRGIRVNAVSPGPVATPILKEFRAVFGDARVDDDIARVGRAGHARPTSRPRCCSSARTARAGSMAPTCRSTAASRPRSTRRCSDFNPKFARLVFMGFVSAFRMV